ncbi:hypothetical protein [Scytonema sp. UIC 10036]|uniref:hypothetical protein n=1 Tax=Scytonema sp. UIC 10036 TaxID=2304196 RepID=UPI00140FFABE|nr:hypothetical protein [Scytonema sp. UIC 10036]
MDINSTKIVPFTAILANTQSSLGKLFLQIKVTLQKAADTARNDSKTQFKRALFVTCVQMNYKSPVA